MKEVSIVCFDLRKCDAAQKTAIQRKLKGYNDHSNKGNYTYKRGGVLHEVPHLRLNRGVICVESKNKRKITSLLRNGKASYKILNFYTNKQVLH
ncbi:MAG TPA: hypothetical protein VJB90_06180 [Candidatus Nanoarchaeia archaeon]|nr:hypothetical protein [Candidatus Nanoarchaeia archaeon]